ncbi:hypothetical protein MMC11_001869 [Xylographa trunciseda]|nr:hypothetical protein [Xylographa trunciseda]
MAQPATEKAPVDCSDYEGLQVDTRARDQTEKDLDTNRDVKSPISPDHCHLGWDDEKKLLWARGAREVRDARSVTSDEPAPLSTISTRAPTFPAMTNDTETTSTQKPLRICGLRPTWFWTLLALILASMIIAAILGGVLTARQYHTSPTTTTPANSTANPGEGPSVPAGSSNPTLPWSDVMVDSPLLALEYPNNTNYNEQSYRLYFQSAHGDVKESKRDGASSDWQEPAPLFTDAANNTGLAVVTYMNGTNQQSSIFYVDRHYHLVQEKRLLPNATIWTDGKIDKLNLQAYGNVSIPESNPEQDPSNTWDGYRMAAVYSTKFIGGPQARLYYHTMTNGINSVVQEQIWSQSNDSWTAGAQFLDPWPNSNLAVTTDIATNTIRLYYSSGNLTLQESWFDLNDQSAGWQLGLQIPTLLAHNDASIAAVSTNTTTMVYYYANDNGVISIRELTLTGKPGSPTYPERSNYASNTPIVAQPALILDSETSIYQPIGAMVSTSGQDQEVQVFWAEGIVDIGSGYSAIKTVQRSVNETWSPAAGADSTEISLGYDNSTPQPTTSPS